MRYCAFRKETEYAYINGTASQSQILVRTTENYAECYEEKCRWYYFGACLRMEKSNGGDSG